MVFVCIWARGLNGVYCAVDDMSSASEVSENETDDDSEAMSANTCSDCHSTSELLPVWSLLTCSRLVF